MQGYLVRQYDGPVRRYCRTLQLRDNPELIAMYRDRHAEGNIWPEILEGIRSVGILEMEIYIRGTLLFMIIETAPDLDLDDAMTRLATLPRQQEWENYMSIFQDCGEGATSDQKWQPMERMFHLY